MLQSKGEMMSKLPKHTLSHNDRKDQWVLKQD